MEPGSKKLPACFYQTPAGNEPVRSWLLNLDTGDRQRVGIDIAKVEFGWPIGMPYCRSLGSGLWEIRSDISSGRTARVLFAIVGEQMVLLHAFVKKTQVTPKDDLELARKRMKEVQ